jgi:hypothetical protein
VRSAVALYLLALAVRSAVFALFPDPAYVDSAYYAEVARSIAAGHGLTINDIWVFAEVGNRLPNPAVLPIPSNAHWLPLASFLQAPFVTLLGPTALASALPGMLIGAVAAPLTFFIARDMGSSRLVASAAGVLVAIPGTATIFMAQPETFPLTMVIVPATLWALARGLRGDGRAFALAGLGAGLLALARNDGILLAGTVTLVWLLDRRRAWRGRHGRRSWSKVGDRAPIPVFAAVLALGLFLVVIGPWWARQLATFGSISPTSASGAALWIRDIAEWNSITAMPMFSTWLAQGPAAILSSRLAGLTAAISIFVVLVTSVALLPFLVIGGIARLGSRDVRPWFLYVLVIFAGATLLYPLHVPGGTFIHTAIGLLPHAMILSVEGIVIAVSWVAGRRRQWREGTAARVLVWGMVAILASTAVVFGAPTLQRWQVNRDARLQVAAALGRAGADPTDRVMSADPVGMEYWTGHPGVVATNDDLATNEAIAKAYGIRWLVLESDDLATPFARILIQQVGVPWLGPEVRLPPAPGRGDVAVYPVCTTPDDTRCAP